MISGHAHVQTKERIDEIVLDNAHVHVNRDLRIVDIDLRKNSQSLQPVSTAMRAWGSEGGVEVLTNSPPKALTLGLSDVENRCAWKPPPREMSGQLNSVGPTPIDR
jgi:hypothetical protein